MKQTKDQMKDHKNTSALHFLDKIGFYFVIGFIFQAIIFKTSQIWLGLFLSVQANYWLITFPYSTYTCLMLPKIRSKPSQRSSIWQIGKHLADSLSFEKLLESLFVYPVLQNNSLSSKSYSAQALKYVLALLLLYHIPEVIALLICYTILCLDYGKTHTDGLLNIPLILISSLYGVMIPLQSSIAMIGKMALLALLSMHIFRPIVPKNSKNLFNLNGYLPLVTQQIDDTFQQLKGSQILLFGVMITILMIPAVQLLQIGFTLMASMTLPKMLYATAYSSNVFFVLSSILSCISTPPLRVLQFFFSCAATLISTKALFVQACIVNVFLGHQLELFFNKSTLDDPTLIPSPDKIAKHYMHIAYHSLKPIINNAFHFQKPSGCGTKTGSACSSL
ncbi:MAG: hypothetical protein VXW87_00465 [Pseudomonadota bacterium]|nr:hypothetical protein [Pseudomonadota bacterium]